MKKLLLSYTILLASAWLFGQQDEGIRILITGLLFGSLVGAMCAYSTGFVRGVVAGKRTTGIPSNRQWMSPESRTNISNT